MATNRVVYANAPITEAALDIRVRTKETPDLKTLSQITDEAYPAQHRQPFQLAVRIQAGDEPNHPTIEQLSAPLGAFHRTEDGKQVFQARVDGFTFNRLAPYDRWDSFSSEARRLWLKYSTSVDIERIESIGLTYLNEILVPPSSPIDSYFRTYIEVAPEIPQVLQNFMLSFQVTLPEGRGILSISQGLGPPRREDRITNTLNIQATKLLYDVNRPSEDQLWAMFESLREAKSDAFEACITDAVREMIR